MKKVSVILLLLLASVSINAQANKISVGMIGTQFINNSGDNKISHADNPFGYGMILGYHFNNEFSVAFTGEFFDNDLKAGNGSEKNFRGHLSVFLMPFGFERVHPYVSGGIVVSHRETNYENSLFGNKNKNIINGRLGLGADIPLIANFSLNGDLGFYTDGFEFVGISTSLGLRYGL